MQVGVGSFGPGTQRRVVRGGGADISDYPANIHGAENCTQVCYMGMMWGGLANWWYELPRYGTFDPQYHKCIESSAAAPVNGLRLQHASQFTTFDLDPAVQKMNITDWRACLCKSFNVFI